jgi:tellurite resistance protein
MGLFESFRSSVTPSFNVQQAIMTIVTAAVLADGDVADEEVSRIRSMCMLSPIFASNTHEQDLAVIKYALNVNSQMGGQAVARAAEALRPELRETAFAFACDMVLADGLVGQNEEAFLTSLMNTLGLAENSGRSIVWATLVRNRGAA